MSWSCVPAGTPVVASLLAVVSVDESVSPLGRLLSVPWVDAVAVAQAVAGLAGGRAGSVGVEAVGLLQALPEALASAAWQPTQSCPATAVRRGSSTGRRWWRCRRRAASRRRCSAVARRRDRRPSGSRGRRSAAVATRGVVARRSARACRRRACGVAAAPAPPVWQVSQLWNVHLRRAVRHARRCVPLAHVGLGRVGHERVVADRAVLGHGAADVGVERAVGPGAARARVAGRAVEARHAVHGDPADAHRPVKSAPWSIGCRLGAAALDDADRAACWTWQSVQCAVGCGSGVTAPPGVAR